MWSSCLGPGGSCCGQCDRKEEEQICVQGQMMCVLMVMVVQVAVLSLLPDYVAVSVFVPLLGMLGARSH